MTASVVSLFTMLGTKSRPQTIAPTHSNPSHLALRRKRVRRQFQRPGTEHIILLVWGTRGGGSYTKRKI
jgi:hypothetical protein